MSCGERLQPQRMYGYMEAFSTIVRFASSYLLLVTVARIISNDVKIIFLNGEIDEEIYMERPIGYKVKISDHHVLFTRSIYDLKQSSK